MSNMSESGRLSQRPNSLLKRGPLTNTDTAEGSSCSQNLDLPRCSSQNRLSRVLAELPKNLIKHNTGVRKSSQSNTDLSRKKGELNVEGRVQSCDNVSRIARNSKIPRATSVRKANSDSFSRGTKVSGADDAQNARKSEKAGVEGTSKENVGTPETGNRETSPLAVHSVREDSQREELGDWCDSKRSSGDFDDSLGPISDDDILDISGDITIRKEALDIAVKLASRTPTEIEDSSALGFPDLAMLDILGASDLSLNVPKNELSFTIFEDMDNITDPSNRTPSAEGIECEGHGSAAPEIASARSPSPIEELPLSSRTPNAPGSIITSITSIMSLDTGYQGDGELSRPESRSAEVDSRLKIPHMENAQAKSIHFDDSKTMTDSDFFTESDADVHDDLSAAAAELGSGKGDRRAQVIDGTLYGGVNVHKRASSDVDNQSMSRENANTTSNCSNDDMASSGIFSDVEKKPEEDFLKAESPSSEHSGTVLILTEPEEGKRPRSESNEGMVKSSSAESSSTIQELAPSVVRTSSNLSSQDTERTVLKTSRTNSVTNKMPNRNVTSKVKVMIESSKAKPEARPKTVRKGKWDAVMDRIAQGREENKYTPARFRDVKSKVYQSSKPACAKSGDEPEGSKSAANNVQSKARSRRNVRVRGSEPHLVSTKNTRKAGSPNSSQRSSISDISVSAVHKQKTITESNQNVITAKSTAPPVTNSVTNNNIGNGKHKTKTVKMVQKKSSPLPTRSKDVIQQKNGALRRSEEKTAGLLQQLRHNSKAFESFAVLLRYCINDLEAFSTPLLKEKLENERVKCRESESRRVEIENHLQEQLMNRIQIIKDLEKENRDCSDKNEELKSVVRDLENERIDLKHKLNEVQEELEMKSREKDQVEEELKRENEELMYRIEETNKVHGVMKKLYEKIKLELVAARETTSKMEVRQKRETATDGESGKGWDSAPDRLESEVESLRQVLSLKTDEICELRRQELMLRENADRVPKLVSTITLLEGKVEDFQSQLSSQIEANRELEKRNYSLEEEVKLTNVQKVRLTQKNEELQYKLRQYAEALRQLVSEKNLTEDDIRNVYLYPKTPQKGDCSVIVDSLPAQMKGVVQKSDSVSYMLEMTEDSSEIVTNIIRRAESLRYASRSQTLPKKKRPKTYSVSSVEALSPFEDYLSGEKPCSSSTKFPFHKDYETDSRHARKNKVVKLQPNDFVPDSIDLSAEDSCEIIEITENFDRTTKQEDLNEMSCSSCSSSTENHFDIESDIYPNGSEAEKEMDVRVGEGYDEGGQEVPTFVDEGDNTKSNFNDFGNTPKTSGGEALSSDYIRSVSP